MFASRASTWPREHFCRSTIAPRSSSPITWNEFLPMSIPIVATVAVDLLDMAVLLGNPVQRHSLVGREHGRTIPLAAVGGAAVSQRTQFVGIRTRPAVD